MRDVAPHNMTSNTAPSPYVASASSNFVNEATAGAWKAFQGSVGASSYWLTAGTNTGYIQIDLGVPYLIVQVSLQANTIPEPNRMIKDGTITSSLNGTDFTTIATVTNSTGWGSGEIRNFPASSIIVGRYVRVNITANNGDAFCQMGEMYVYAADLANFHRLIRRSIA